MNGKSNKSSFQQAMNESYTYLTLLTALLHNLIGNMNKLYLLAKVTQM